MYIPVPAGMLYWQAEHGVQIFALLSIATATGFYIMAPVTTHLLLPRASHVFELEMADGVCHPWQFVLHSYCHLAAIMVLPSVFGGIVTSFMVINAPLPAKDLALAVLFGLLAEAWVVSYVILLVCLFPKKVFHFYSVSTMLTTAFQGFVVPRVGIPVFLRWITFLNPIFWAYSGLVQALVKDKELPCAKDSPLNCAEKNLNLLIVQFGLEVVNPYVAILVLLLWTMLCLTLAIAFFLPWRTYKEALKRKIFPKGEFLLCTFTIWLKRA